MDVDKEKIIREVIEEFFEKASLEESPNNIKIESNLVSFELQSESPEILIGKRGQILANIQYVLSKIIERQLGEKIFVDFDINQYKKKKTGYLKELAKNTADEVSLNGEERSLFPMTSYERRIVHLALAEREDVRSESVGEEPERRIIIKLA